MLDRYSQPYTFYPQVPTILAAARAKGITLSVASRTHTPDLAEVLLRGIDIPPLPEQDTGTTETETDTEGDTNGHGEENLLKSADTTPQKAITFFTAPQMYPGSKVTHFRQIQKATRIKKSKSGDSDGDGGEVAFADMLFFDDEARNKDVERELGATFVLVRDGVTVEEVDRGVREWRRRRAVQPQ